MKGLLESHDSEELRNILDCLGVAAFVIDVDARGGFRIAALNTRHEQLTGMSHAQVAGRSIDEVLTPAMSERVTKKYRQCIRQRTAIDYQETLDLPVGRTHWHTTLVPYMDVTGRVFRLLGTSVEISASVHLELESRYQSTLLSAYLEESPDGILVVDADNHIKTWNQRFLEIWDIPEEIMQSGDGVRALQVVRKQLKAPDEFAERIIYLYNHLDMEERAYRVEMEDGRVYERYSRGLHDDQGTYWGRIWFYRDITRHEKMTEELQRLAWTDVLTDTANRRAFMASLTDEYRRARRYARSLSLIMIDLDRFKAINDQYGHEGGDLALQAFAAAVRPLLRLTDIFARVGGEEFAILLPETDLQESLHIADRILKEVATLSVTSSLGIFGITASIGVADTHDSDKDAEEMFRRADQALYRAKGGGRNRVAQIQ